MNTMVRHFFFVFGLALIVSGCTDKPSSVNRSHVVDQSSVEFQRALAEQQKYTAEAKAAERRALGRMSIE